jgi:ubiquinone biosynthesis protein
MLPSDLLLVGKAMATMEGIALELVPDFRPLEAVRPYLTEVYLRRMLDAKRHSQVAVRSLTDGLALLKDAPADVRRILRKLRRGELSVVLRHADADERNRALGVRSTRFVLGMLFPVFFFGGTYLVGADSGLQNLAGLVSFCLAGIFFVGLSVSLLRGTGGSSR